MKHLFRTICLACFVFVCLSAQAQTGKVVQGMLRDNESRVVTGASVQLIAGKDTLGTSSSAAGIYIFNNVKADVFKIRVNSLGFDAFEQEFTFPKGDTKMIIPSFELKGIANMLEEVIISGVVSVQVKGDTIEYSTKDLKLREGSVAEDALKKLQGVEVDKDGNVTAQGESVTRVRINGKDFFGGDVKTATQNLPANIIQKMQIVDDFGDMANLTGNKSGSSEKVLNIQIDPQYNKGYMTTLRAGYGTEDRYQGTGMLMLLSNKTQVSILGNLNNMNAQLFDFSSMGGGARGRSGGGGGRSGRGMFGGAEGLTNTGSIGLNVRHDFSEKLKVYGSYSFGRDDNTTLSSNRTSYFGIDQVDSSNTDNNSIKASHRFEANLEWNITDKDYLKLTPQFGFDNNDNTGFENRRTYLGSAVNNIQKLNTISTSSAPRYNISGLYNRKLNDKGRNFFLNFNYDNAVTESDFNRVSDKLIGNVDDPNASLDSIYELTIQELMNKSWNAGGTLSYTEPLSEKGRLELTYDLNVNDYDNRNKQVGYDRDGNISDDSHLNFKNNYDYDYDYAFTTHRAGASYIYSGEKLSYTVGASFQPTSLSGMAYSGATSALIDRKNFNIFPIARFEYKFSRQKNITVNYSGQTTEPGVSQILPFEVSTNRSNITIGNPDLDPEFRHQVQTRFRSGDFQKGNTFFAMLSANLTRNKIVNFTKSYTDDAPAAENVGLLRETRFLNAGESLYGINSFYHYGKSLKEKTYNVMYMGSISYNKNFSFTAVDRNALIGDKNITNNWVFMQGVGFRYNPSENLEINPGIRYTYNYTNNSAAGRGNLVVSSWIPNIIGSVNLSPTTIFGADLSKTFNKGYSNDANPFIINTYIEQKFLQGQRATIRLQAFDLLNEQTNISRVVSGVSLSDSQTNRLGRYFMLIFTYKLQKFSGMNPFQEESGHGGMRRPRM